MPSTTPHQDDPRHFLVELNRPSEGWQVVSDVTARARSAATVVRRGGTDVRLVRSVYAPESDSLFLVYRATTEDAVLVAVQGAELSPTHVSAAIDAVDGGRR